MKSVVPSIPFQVQPLQPTLVKPFHRPGWIYEEKVDGWRIVAYKDGPRVRLVSRRGNDHTPRFPDVAAAIRDLPDTALVLDGEVAVFDERLVSRFDLLAEPDPAVPTTPPVYVAFDVLWAGRDDLRSRPLAARREALERIVDGARLIYPVRRLAPDGRKAWDEVLARGIEGYVGKDESSTYLAGGVTRSWLRAKVRQEGQFIVGGVVERSEGFSLLLGTMQSGRLAYRGLVHWDAGRRLGDALLANGLVRATSPFAERVPVRDVMWLEPRLVAEVSFTHAIPDGGLRGPVFRGFAANQ